MNREDFILLLAVHFVVATVLPVMNLVLVSFGIGKVKLCTDLTGALDIAVSKPIFYPLIGYYVDYKYYRVKDEPDTPTYPAIEEADEPVDAAIEETDKPRAAATEETDKPGAAAVEETYVYGSASTGGADDPEDQESGQ